MGELAVSSKFKADLEKSCGNSGVTTGSAHIIYDGFKLFNNGEVI